MEKNLKSKIIKTNNKIDQIVQITTGLVFIVLVLLILISVISRILGVPISWSEIIARYFFIWMVLLGPSFFIKQDGFIKVDFLVKKYFSKKVYQIHYLAIYLLVIFFILYIFVYLGIQLTIFSIGQLEIFNIPLAYLRGAIPIGGILMIYNLIIKMIIEGERRGKDN